jgi:hypothetical protein
MKKYIKRVVNFKWFPYIFIAIVWAFTILPSAINSNWFFLDDPTSVVQGAAISENLDIFTNPSSSGRFIPVYWYYRGFIFRLFGNTPTPSYLIQSITILISILIIYLIVKKLSKSKLIGIIGALVFMTGSGISENSYTIGKQEPLVLLSLLIVLYATTKLYDHTIKRKEKIIYFIVSALFTLMGIWNKEPSLVIAAVGIVTLINAIVQKKKEFLSSSAIILGVVLSRIPQMFLLRGEQGESYTNYPINASLIRSNLVSYLNQNPDFIILLCITGVLGTIYLIKKFGKSPQNILKNNDDSLILAIYAIAFVYTAVLLIWRWPLGYYLYVPLGLLSIVFATLLSKVSKKLFYVSVIIIIFTRLISIPYNLYTGVAQYNLNHLFSASIEEFQVRAPQSSRLIVENWDFYGEEAYQTNLLIQSINGRTDLKVEGIADLISNRKISEETLALYGWKEKLDPVARWPKVNDYVLVLTSNLPAIWRVRDVMPVTRIDSELTKKGFELELLTKEEINFRLPFLESEPYKLKWRISQSSQGYKLYRVTKTPSNLNELYQPK